MIEYFPADIGLSAPNGIFDISGEIIAAVETEPDPKCPKWPCHAWLTSSTPQTLIEALSHVTISPISKYTLPGSQPSLVLRVRSWTDAQRQAAADKAMTMVGNRYGFEDVLADAVDSVLSLAEHHDVIEARKGAPVDTTRDCAVLVAICTAMNAWAFCRYPVSAVEPSTIFCDYWDRPDAYEVVFCAESLKKFIK